MDRLAKADRSALMRRVRRADTKPERDLRHILFSLGYRYTLHDKRLMGHPDVVFTARRCVIFVHGCFWHGHNCRNGRAPKSNVAFWSDKIGRNRERDRRVEQDLACLGWRVMTVWQCELSDAEVVAQRLRDFLGAPRFRG